MAKRKPKIGGRVYWQSEDGAKEFGTILEVSPSGTRVEVQWDQAPEYHEAGDTFTYDLGPASGVRVA
jgi:hypothetical protein